ncbi:MAG: hypothetical protein KGR24_10410 [Planctomycetes bacterium]|nr:hypothetical protein [Planctomycetota bacterium]
MTHRRSATPWLVAAFLAGIVAAWAFTPSRSPAPAPWSPVPSPHETRPILAGVVRLAKTLGWLLVFAQPAPPEVPETPAARLVDEQPEEPAEVGSDGYAVLRNQRGW